MAGPAKVVTWADRTDSPSAASAAPIEYKSPLRSATRTSITAAVRLAPPSDTPPRVVDQDQERGPASTGYLVTGQDRLCLCAVCDGCSRRVIGYTSADSLRADLVVAALRRNVTFRDPATAPRLVEQGLGWVQPLTPVRVMPWMNIRWAKKNRMMIGITVIVAAAISGPKSVANCPLK